MNRAGHIEEQDTVAEVRREDLVPIEGDFLGAIDRVAEREVLLVDGLAGDQGVWERGGFLAVAVVRAIAGVVAVALERADGVKAAELFDPDVEAGEIDGLDAVSAGTAGELGLVVAGQDQLGVEPFEGDGRGPWGA